MRLICQRRSTSRRCMGKPEASSRYWRRRGPQDQGRPRPRPSHARGGKGAPLRASLPVKAEDDDVNAVVNDATEADAPEVLRRRLSRLLGGLLRSDPADEIGDDGSPHRWTRRTMLVKTRRTRPATGGGRLGNSVASGALRAAVWQRLSPKSDAALNKAYRECDFEILEKDASSADILARLAQNRAFCHPRADRRDLGSGRDDA